MKSTPDRLIVAAGQIVAAPLADAEKTLEAVVRLTRRAGTEGADLVVLPECSYPAYWIESVEAFRNAPLLRPEEYVDLLRRLARELALCIVSGFVETDGDRLANAAVWIDADGRERARHRKTFLWGRDNEWFTPGDRIEPLDTPLGRIGMIICAEARCPEIVATHAARGAQLLAMPTCWFNTGRVPGEYTNPQIEFMIESRAREFGMAFVCADKSGRDGEHAGYAGRSIIVDSDGTCRAEAPATGEALLVAEVTLGTPRPARIVSPLRERLLRSPSHQDASGVVPASTTVAVVPGGLWRTRCAAGGADAFFGELRAQGARLVVSNTPDETNEQLCAIGRACGVAFLGRSSADEAGKVFQWAGIPVGIADGDAARTFAPMRGVALDGALAVFVLDAPRDLVALRTRAVENRIYVIAVADDLAAVIAPDGRATLVNNDWIITELDLASAADKCVTPQTDVFAQRRTEAFDFSESTAMKRPESIATGAIAGLMLAGCAAGPSATPPVPGQRAQVFEKTLTQSIRCRYLLYLPPGYGETAGERWPLVLFLHGAGERGDDLELVKRHGPPRLVAEGRTFPFILVSPQCPPGEWWSPEILVALLDDFAARYAVDPDRVYVTGLSMGGMGTWELAIRYPGRFAAVAPICGRAVSFAAPQMRNVPSWVFHGEQDAVVPVEESKRMADALKRCGAEVRLTIYPEAGHDSWTETYNNPELYTWLLQQRRHGAPASKP